MKCLSAFLFLFGVMFSVMAQPGVPTPEQIAWHEMEIQMFLCLDPCTWQGREYDDHSTPLESINPSLLDTEQWCETAKSFGAKQILFVAKHTGGFCWWPTETTEYCVRNIPWKNGKGDVLGELAESCKRHGLKLGVYIYPGDDQWGAGIGSGGRTADPAKQEEYNAVLRRQWTEVLTNYGEVSELWFDGSCVIDLSDIIQEHAPKAMVFQGPHATLRWPGNEQGVAPEPAWQTVRRDGAASGGATGSHSDPDGEVWLPMEMDTPLLDHKWFWAPETDHMLKPLDKLMDIYLSSVGRGGVLLLNATPDTTGLIPESHLARYREFGAAIQRLYENKKGGCSGEGTAFTIDFEHPTAVSHVVIQEDIRRGHAVRKYRVEGLSHGDWQLLAEGEPVGYKRIETFDKVEVTALRLLITESATTPNILHFDAYETDHFAGIPADAKNEWLVVEAWQSISPSAEWQTVEIDLTPVITEPGEYRIEIRPEEGGASLETAGAVIVIAGVEAPRLIAPLDAPNAWLVQRTDQVTSDEKGRTTLRLCVRGDANSHKMFIRKTGQSRATS
jgi:alpha-L-fucosidase